MKVHQLLSDESRWTGGALARTRAGEAVRAENPEAVSWCLSGALAKCYPDLKEWGMALGTLAQALGVCCVSAWNDDPARTFEEVRDLVVTLDL